MTFGIDHRAVTFVLLTMASMAVSKMPTSMKEAAKNEAPSISNNLNQFKPQTNDQDAQNGFSVPSIPFGTETIASPGLYVVAAGGMKYSGSDNVLRPLYLADTGMLYTADSNGKNVREMDDARIRRNFAWFLLDRAPLSAPTVAAFFKRYYDLDSDILPSVKTGAASNGTKENKVGTHAGKPGSAPRSTFEPTTPGMADLMEVKTSASRSTSTFTASAPTASPILTEDQKRTLATYLEKKDSYDPHTRYAKEQELIRNKALEKPEDILSAPDLAFIELMKEKRFNSVQGRLDPGLCSGSKLFSNYMAKHQNHYPPGGAHFGFASGWNYDGHQYPNRSAAGGSMEISSTSNSGLGSGEAMARMYFKKDYRDMSEWEKLKAHAQACLHLWQNNSAGPTHWNTANTRYNRYCYTMSKGSNGQYYCNGIVGN